MRTLSEQDVVAMISSLSNWGRWGPDDELGTINLITSEKRRRAAALVRDGVSVSCARPIVTNDIAADTIIRRRGITGTLRTSRKRTPSPMSTSSWRISRRTCGG